MSGKAACFLSYSMVVVVDGWCEVEAPRRGYVVYGGVKVEMSDSGDGRILNAI